MEPHVQRWIDAANRNPTASQVEWAKAKARERYKESKLPATIGIYLGTYDQRQYYVSYTYDGQKFTIHESYSNSPFRRFEIE